MFFLLSVKRRPPRVSVSVDLYICVYRCVCCLYRCVVVGFVVLHKLKTTWGRQSPGRRRVKSDRALGALYIHKETGTEYDGSKRHIPRRFAFNKLLETRCGLIASLTVQSCVCVFVCTCVFVCVCISNVYMLVAVSVAYDLTRIELLYRESES